MQGYDLTNSDYEDILDYYNIEKPIKNKNTKLLAEDILSNKLCRCIKRVGKLSTKENEKRNIAICRKSVLTRKNLNFNKFKCRNKPRFLQGKNGKILQKTSKNLKLNKKTRKNKDGI
ncbi:MAG: hypothetical protein CXT73_07470 [Methanobacteriota archaeon]|jgi:hypothetical protein|nr:MAG: hypothetical protein CXT73_07470 [Euryarchaeota archaeon]